MSESNIQTHLKALKDFADDIKSGSGNVAEIQIKKKQLAAVQRTIRQLEKNHVPVMEGLSNEKLTLVSEIEDLENASDGCIKVYETLLDIVLDLSRTCNRLPHKDLYHRIKKWRQKTTPPDTLRKVIISILKEADGSAKEREILPRIEEKLKSQFTPADLERSHGKRFKWQTNVRRERKKMIADGILTSDSNRSTWTLER